MRDGQQGEGGDCLPQLCPFEAPPAVLSPALGLPARGCRGVGTAPQEGCEDDHGAGAAFLSRKVEGAGKEKAPGGPCCSLPILEWSL